MTDPREKLANLLREIKIQRAAMTRKLGGAKNRNFSDRVNACMRKYRGLAAMEEKARNLEHQIRSQQQASRSE